MIKKIRRLFSLLIIFIVFLVGYSAYSVWSFSEKNELVKSDAAIVLGAAAWHNRPSPVLKERVNHSIWLYDNGYVDKLIFTGGKGEGAPFAESEVARDYAISQNVAPEDIFIETKSTITEENLLYAQEIAFEHNLNSFTVVSDPLHMKRAILLAENIGLDVHSSPTTTSAYQSLNSKIPFFFREVFFYVGYLLTNPFR
ncbi:YdcF family protein [Cytobacillus sp. FJAT-54145]|uniref:YdcF family protein n=1 Tax=Cytobacillus spartinae TaxID=3299023 RepID=A0ABW6K6B0_9BACI